MPTIEKPDNTAKMSTVEKLETTAMWFFKLAWKSLKVWKLYRKAARQLNRASRTTEKAIQCSKSAHLAASEILGGDTIVSNGSPQEVPEVIIDPEAHKQNFMKWLDALQIDPDLVGNETGSDEE